MKRKAWKAFPTTPKTLGDYIKARRFEKGILQRELAAKLGVRKVYIQLWEQDRKTPTEAERARLVRLLGDLNGHPCANPTAE